MKNISFTIRSMHSSDIGYAIKLSNAESWNQTEKDWSFLTGNSENICLVAEYGNKVIGTITAINYSNKAAWIGMVLVDKEYRGQGVSKSLLTAIFKKLETFKSIKLDATSAGQPVYKKFQFEDEYFIARMTNSSLKSLPTDEYDIVPELIQLNQIQETVAFDEHIFGVNRSQLIEFLIRNYPHKAWLLKRNKTIAGFALGRDGNQYHQIGPVMAATTADAKILIKRALMELNHQAVVVDVLYDKEDMVSWLNSIGFIEQRHFIRMYKKENPFPGAIANHHLICGPEFG